MEAHRKQKRKARKVRGENALCSESGMEDYMDSCVGVLVDERLHGGTSEYTRVLEEQNWSTSPSAPPSNFINDIDQVCRHSSVYEMQEREASIDCISSDVSRMYTEYDAKAPVLPCDTENFEATAPPLPSPSELTEIHQPFIGRHAAFCATSECDEGDTNVAHDCLEGRYGESLSVKALPDALGHIDEKINSAFAANKLRNALSTASDIAEDQPDLYPAIPHCESFGYDTAQWLHSQKKPVQIKLDPYVSHEVAMTRAKANKKQHERRMNRIPHTRDHLYVLLERYLYAEYIVRVSCTTIKEKKDAVDELISYVWTLETKRMLATKTCADQKALEQSVSFQSAKLDIAKLENLEKHLKNLRELRSSDASLHAFDCALAYLGVEQHLKNVCEDPELDSLWQSSASERIDTKLTQSDALSTDGDINLCDEDIFLSIVDHSDSYPSESVETKMEYMKQCIDILIFFEKDLSLDSQHRVFGRVPSFFNRGKVILNMARNHKDSVQRNLECYICKAKNNVDAINGWSKVCQNCNALLYLPPVTHSDNSLEWKSCVVQFQTAVKRWISICIKYLLRLKSLSHAHYLLMHAMYLPGIADERSWFLHYVRFPRGILTFDGCIERAWTEELVDHYISMLHLLYNPENISQDACSIWLNAPNKVNNKTAPKSEWVMLENPRSLESKYLSDQDFVCISMRFPHKFAFQQVFSSSSDLCKSFGRALTIVTEVTANLEAITEFKEFTLLSGQLITELLNAAHSFKSCVPQASSMYESAFDQLLLTALHKLILSKCNRIAWKPVKQYPFRALSLNAKWDALGILLYAVRRVPDDAKRLSGWLVCATNESDEAAERGFMSLRDELCQRIAHEGHDFLHLLRGVTALTSFLSAKVDGELELIAVILHELFSIAIVSAERYREALKSDASIALLSAICLTHPQMLSHMIRLIDRYHHLEPLQLWMAILEAVPINRWKPTFEDLTILRNWIVPNELNSIPNSLARFLLDRMNWELDMEHDELFLDPQIHCEIAFIIVEALITHETPRIKDSQIESQSNWLPEILPQTSVHIKESLQNWLSPESLLDLSNWCWKILPKLKFFSASNSSPHLPLLDLVHGNSDKETQLRCWYPLTTFKSKIEIDIADKVPFYSDQAKVWLSSRADTEKLSYGYPSSHPMRPEYPAVPIQSAASSMGQVGEKTIWATSPIIRPVVAYLVCRATTFLYMPRLDRWEPMLDLIRYGHGDACLDILATVIPALSSSIFTECGDDNELSSTPSMFSFSHVNTNGINDCMGALDSLSFDELEQFIVMLENAAYISKDHCSTLLESLSNFCLYGGQRHAKDKIFPSLQAICEQSQWLHPMILPLLYKEDGQIIEKMTSMETLRNAFSWLQAALITTHDDTKLMGTRSLSRTFAAWSSMMSNTGSEKRITSRLSMVTAAIVQCCIKALGSDAHALSAVMYWCEAVTLSPLWYTDSRSTHILNKIMETVIKHAVTHVFNASGSTADGARLLSMIVASLQQKFIAIYSKGQSGHEGRCAELYPYAGSLLPRTDASLVSTLTSTLFGSNIEFIHTSNISIYAFWALLIETIQEQPLFLAVSALMIQYEPRKSIKMIEKLMGDSTQWKRDLAKTGFMPLPSDEYNLLGDNKKRCSIQSFRLYCWAALCLAMDENNPYQILYWQIFFAQYFVQCKHPGSQTHTIAGLYWFNEEATGSTFRTNYKKNLKDRLITLATYYSTQAQLALTQLNTVSSPSSAIRGEKYRRLSYLSQTYSTMAAFFDISEQSWTKDGMKCGLDCRSEELYVTESIRAIRDAIFTPAVDQDHPIQGAKWQELISLFWWDRIVDSHTSESVPGQWQPLEDAEEFTFVSKSEICVEYELQQLREPTPIPDEENLMGATFLKMLPCVKLDLSAAKCSLQLSMDLNIPLINSFAENFSESLSNLITLDLEMIELVQNLHKERARAITQSQSCADGLDCKDPAIFMFEFHEWVIDENVQERIKSVQAQADQYDLPYVKFMYRLGSSRPMYNNRTFHDIDSVDNELDKVGEFLKVDKESMAICLQILVIQGIVAELTLRAEKFCNRGTEQQLEALQSMDSSRKEVSKLHETGIQWFRTLTELDNSTSRIVPILRETLWKSIKLFGASFVAVDEQETNSILDLMLQDTSRINVLCDCFQPAKVPGHFVHMFTKFMCAYSSGALRVDEAQMLFPHFDFDMWLSNDNVEGVGIRDREAVISIILSAASTVTGDSDTLLLQMYANAIHSICVAHLGDHIESVLTALMGQSTDYRMIDPPECGRVNCSHRASAQEPVDGVLWDAILSVPTSNWKSLSEDCISICVHAMSRCMDTLRKGDVQLMQSGEGNGCALLKWHKKALLKRFLDVYSVLCRTHQALPNTSSWTIIESFFKPLLSTYTTPSPTSQVARMCTPWNFHSPEIGDILCSCFAAICLEHIECSESDVDMSSSLTKVWELYTCLVKNAPAYVCRLLHQHLTRLPWDKWSISLQIVQKMRDCVSTEQRRYVTETSSSPVGSRGKKNHTATSYPHVAWFIRDVLCRLTWSLVGQWASNATMRSVLLLELAKLCVDLTVNIPVNQLSYDKKQESHSRSDVLPPYYRTFMRRLRDNLSIYDLEPHDLQALLTYCTAALRDPFLISEECDVEEDCADKPQLNLLLDVFNRAQLILELVAHVTMIELNHVGESTPVCERNRMFFRAIFSIIEAYDEAYLNTGKETALILKGSKQHRVAWKLVLYGGCCIALYERLKDLVEVTKDDRISKDVELMAEDSAIHKKLVMQTIAEVLSFLDLPLLHQFFENDNASLLARCRDSSVDRQALSLNAFAGRGCHLPWNKLRSLVHSDIVSLIRDSVTTNGNTRHSRKRANEHLHPQDPIKVAGSHIGRLLWVFIGHIGNECSTLEACGRSVASVKIMCLVTEGSIERWIMESSKGSWLELIDRLRVPELSLEDFESACQSQGNVLTLILLLLQHTKLAATMSDGLNANILSKITLWLEMVEKSASFGGERAKSSFELKILYFIAEAGCIIANQDHLPMPYKKKVLRDLCNVALRFGNARNKNGLMKAIGLGGTLKYSIEFHVCSLAIGIFLRIQTRNSLPLRTDTSVPLSITRTTEKHINSLEHMLASNDCARISKKLNWVTPFLQDPKRNLQNREELFTGIFSSLYPAQSWMLVRGHNHGLGQRQKT